MIDVGQLKQICPSMEEPEIWAPLLTEEFAARGFETKEQQARFIAQTAHESADYNVLVENLNYSTERLIAVFPRYFKSTAEAQQYSRNPQKIANKVYASRMGNGDESTGDGYEYRGRGVLQITGKTNYAHCSEYMYGSDDVLISYPDLLLNPEEALGSAFWYWDVNSLIDIDNFVLLTKRINGGTNGLQDRQHKYNIAIQVL